MFIDFSIKDLIDILLVAYLLYQTYRLMKDSGSINIFIGILVSIGIWLIVSQVLEMKLLGSIFDKLVSVGVLALIILFQDDIRRFLVTLGSHKQLGRFFRFLTGNKQEKTEKADIMPIVLACMSMSKGKVGALIVIEKWMSKEEFMEMFALTQSLPGVFAVNISIFVGYKLHKVIGSLVCALATILPSFVIMMLIAMFFARFQDNEVMIRIFNGIRPAVVALILFPCISAVRALKLKYIQLIAPLIATVLIWQFGLSPIYVVLAGIAGGLVYILWLKDKIKDIKA